MTRYLTRDRAAVAAAVIGPLALAALLLPWRGSWSNTNVRRCCSWWRSSR